MQNPIEQDKEAQRGDDQHNRVEDEDVDLEVEVPLRCAEEDVRLVPTAVIVLLHLGVGKQVGNFLVHIDLLGRDWTGGVLEQRAVERTIAVEDLIDQMKITIKFASRFRLQAGQYRQRFL